MTAAEATVPFSLVANREDLERSLAALAATHGPLGIDTEFLRKKTYHAKLALLQVSDGAQSFLYDPLALDLAPLLRLLEGRELLVHSGGQDLEILCRDGAFTPRAVRDTQLATQCLGRSGQVGLGALLEELLGVKLAKDETVSDWMRRPLSANQLLYAHEDVVHLPRLYAILAAELEREGKTAIFQEECSLDNMLRPRLAAMVDKHLFPGDSPFYRALVGDLFAWREEMAERKDIPGRWILEDSQLLKVARIKDPELWLEKGVLSPAAYKKYAGVFRSLHGKHAGLPDARRKLSHSAQTRLNALEDDLRAAVARTARQHRFSPEFLCSGRVVQQVARRIVLEEGSDAGLPGWRGSILNPVIEALRTEKKQPAADLPNSTAP